MKLTENYFAARDEAMSWLSIQPNKRKYSKGLAILVQSGYKTIVADMLRRHGERDWTMEKLTSCLREMIQVYYNPADPRFEDVPDVDVLNYDEGDTTEISEANKIVKQNSSDKFDRMPESIQVITRNFSSAFKERAKLHRRMSELGETNDEDIMTKRKAMSDEIERLTSYMDALFKIKDDYDKNGNIPSSDNISKIKDCLTDKKEQVKDKIDYSNFTTDKLKVRHKSITTQITRKNNLLLYQTKCKQIKENPMPDCPKRVKMLRQVEHLKSERSKIEYELANRE
jgi:chaperonin cofactor prefoldin